MFNKEIFGVDEMSNSLRKLKREKNKISPSSKEYSVWNQGFNEGAKSQNEADRQYLVKLLRELEGVPGIGSKTADKVRRFLKERFGK